MIESAHQHRLWQANLRVAEQLVRDYCYDPLLSQDALQEAKLGLWEATFNWQEEMSASFNHYAWLHMRRKLFNYLMEASSERPKLTRLERLLMGDLRKHLRAGQLISCHLMDALCQETGITRLRLAQLVSYWYQGSLAISASSMEIIEEMTYEEQEPETDVSKLDEAILNLPEREKLIILSRYLQDPRSTLADLAAKFGVSIERVRQLESGAMKKLKKHLQSLQPSE